MDTYNLAPYATVDTGDKHALSFGFDPHPHLNFGASKLIARFAQLLLTLKGSDKTDPGAGCRLLSLVATFHTSERGFLRNEIDAIISDLSFQMLHENDPAVPPEGRFVSASCENVDVLDDTVHIDIRIKTAAETQIQFTLPIAAH